MVGRIVECSRSLTGNLRVTFEVDSLDELRGMEDKEITLEAKISRNKRSLNANAYFHVLVGKIAEKLHISKQRAKNILLGKYGQREILDQGPMIVTIIETVDMLEREDIHCVPVGHGVVKGKNFTHWAVLKPSHEYDTREMAALIDGTIEDAKELEIETMTPAEIERMKASWNNGKN